ncbi:MAG: methyltransferase family protein [Micromonosporaceae bacterium]
MTRSQARPALVKRLFAGVPGLTASVPGRPGPPGLARHLYAVIACPGKFALLIPAVLVTLFGFLSELLRDWSPATAEYLTIAPAVRWWAIAVAAAGIGLVVWTNVLFHRNLGTLHPDDGPRRLVTTGPYGYLRNPMITGIIAFLVGAAGILGSPVLAGYVVAFSIAKTWYLRNSEEPQLTEAFGEEYLRYKEQVPYLWLPWRR